MPLLRAFALGMCCAVVGSSFGIASTARADGPTGLVIGGKLGGGIGEPLNQSGPSFMAEVELGYVLPPLDHALELFSAFAYTAPAIDGSATLSDPRLPGDGLVRYRVEQQIGAVGLGLRYRLPLPVVTPYAAVGGRLYLMRSKVSGEVAGESFGDNEETGTAFGGFFAGGVELGLGPGALLGEAQVAYGGVDGYVLRDTNVGALSLMLGYRLMFPAPSRASITAGELGEASFESELPAAQPRRAAHDEAAAPEVAEAAPEIATETAGVAETEHAADGGSAAPEPVVQPAVMSAEAAGKEEAAAAPAQVRGHIRSFSGEPLRATIRLKPRGFKASTDARGYFQLDVPPGRYTVRLRSYGYVSQTRRIIVEENGVTVLNVELGKK